MPMVLLPIGKIVNVCDDVVADPVSHKPSIPQPGAYLVELFCEGALIDVLPISFLPKSQSMHESDSVIFAVFDDEPQSIPALVIPAARPDCRPRPDPSTHPQTDPVALIVFDSNPEPEPPAHHHPAPEEPALALDICLFDAALASFVRVYSAGTPLSALKPRTMSIPAHECDLPVTSIVLHARAPADAHPVPYLTFQFPEDIRGKRLTLRFADPADPNSLLIDCDSSGSCSPLGNP